MLTVLLLFPDVPQGNFPVVILGVCEFKNMSESMIPPNDLKNHTATITLILVLILVHLGVIHLSLCIY